MGPFTGKNQVTILGQYLETNNDITSVTFNGVSATVLSQSPTAVVVIVPAPTQTGPATVMIESVSQGTASLAAAYTYNPGIVSFIVLSVTHYYQPDQ